MIDTDVLVCGCGPAGLTTATALARQGVSVLAITRHRQLAPTPRAHVTNQRTFEILRDFGIEAEAMTLATSYDRMPNQIFMHSLVGEEFGRIRGLGTEGGNADASPCVIADLPQHLLEPVLFRAAVRFGAHVRFEMELVSFAHDETGVRAEIVDRLSGERETVRARYLVGADGGQSRVADTLGLPFEGEGEIGGSANILFEADLSRFVAHRPGLLFFMVRTPGDRDGPGLGILRCIKPWSSWLMIKGYASGEATPNLGKDEAAEVVRDYLGVPDLDVRITGVDPWAMNARYATRYHEGRVFCVGDAVHRHVPSNGLGSNTGIQDGYNLAWKLALVLHGQADAGLLESFSEERVPIGRQVVARATASLSSYGPVLDAIGVLAPDAEHAAANMKELTRADAAGAARREILRRRIGDKVYEFQTRGIELNQLYRSLAILNDGQEPPPSDLDLELFHRPTTCPGSRLPHASVQRDGHSLSTLDLVGGGRFAVLTGVGGDPWLSAAREAAAALGVNVVAVAIGPGCPVTDLTFAWSDRREIAEDGCLLVRPDGYVAWRCHSLRDSPNPQVLVRALRSVLSLN